MTRYTQGWVDKYTDSLEEALSWALEAQKAKEPCAIAYHGNVVDLLEMCIRDSITAART